MSAPTLQRRLGLVQATALNMIDRVGIGSFVTLPLVMGWRMCRVVPILVHYL